MFSSGVCYPSYPLLMVAKFLLITFAFFSSRCLHVFYLYPTCVFYVSMCALRGDIIKRENKTGNWILMFDWYPISAIYESNHLSIMDECVSNVKFKRGKIDCKRGNWYLFIRFYHWEMSHRMGRSDDSAWLRLKLMSTRNVSTERTTSWLNFST